jgi:DNA-binding CsgD family transcriptional regulator
MINLNFREKEYIRMKADGLTDKDIGELLFMDIKTVDVLSKELRNKTGTCRSANLISWAYQNGVLKINRENPPHKEDEAA